MKKGTIWLLSVWALKGMHRIYKMSQKCVKVYNNINLAVFTKIGRPFIDYTDVHRISETRI